MNLEGEQLGHLSGFDLCEGVVFDVCGEQYAKATKVFAVDVEDGLVDPTLTKADPR